jgi:glycosyltransferase involved in cell wall biosynthesis
MSDPGPLVSVVIPTYNRADLLRQAIDSVLAQTYRPLELVVVDDGSTDGTPELLRSYGERLVAIRQRNQGGTAARNAGTQRARGAFLNWLDHDDLMRPDKIARQMQVFRAQPALGLVHCGYDKIDAEGQVLERLVGLPEGDVARRLVCGCFLWSGAPLVKRACIERVGAFDESVWSSDADLWLRIALAGYAFGCVQEPLGKYRILADSTMADVARTERLDFAILDRVFARADLSSQVAAMRTEAYFNQRFWLATRYYTIGRWHDARRNLTLALELKPALLASEAVDLLLHLSGAALDPRVGDPLRFTRDVLAHLPPVAAALAPYGARLESRVQLRMALREYAHGRIDQARDRLAAALDVDRHVVSRSEHFAAAVYESARHHSCEPEDHLDLVLGNLPGSAQELARRRSVFLGWMRWWSAAEHRACGRWSSAGRDLVAALRQRPAFAPWLARRAFLRSGSVVKQILLRAGRATGTVAPIGRRSAPEGRV